MSLDEFAAFRCDAPLDTALFFYHVPKTAGTTVEAVLHALATERGRTLRLVPRAVGMRERPPPAGFFEDERPLAYAGHCWFGAHRWVGRPVHACTVLREPVERVVSEYLWRNANRNRAASADDFRHYLDNLALSNLATRLLAGESEIDWRSVDRAIAHLGSCFLVGRTERLAPFLSAILSLYGGPSVRTRPAKQQRDPRKAQLIEMFGDEIARRNAYDRTLYDYAEAHLFGRADALLRGFSEPAPRRVQVDNPNGKQFVVRDD
ncbi:hypothetical protein [Stella sp.]|uniref:hypothetical protein n=1 Tax=Stella sp. TaxID=2912054 RepID=UPI0035B0CF17